MSLKLPEAARITKSKRRRAVADLFHSDQVLVWSQPSAVVDNVIYKWQQQLESAEYRQEIDLIYQVPSCPTVKKDETALRLKEVELFDVDSNWRSCLNKSSMVSWKCNLEMISRLFGLYRKYYTWSCSIAILAYQWVI